LLGFGLGGFGQCLQQCDALVPKISVAKALSIIYAAVSVATVVAAPMGSYLGTLIGWRNVFLIAAGLGTIAFIMAGRYLATMPNDKPAKAKYLYYSYETR